MFGYVGCRSFLPKARYRLWGDVAAVVSVATFPRSCLRTDPAGLRGFGVAAAAVPCAWHPGSPGHAHRAGSGVQAEWALPSGHGAGSEMVRLPIPRFHLRQTSVSLLFCKTGRKVKQ